MSKCSHRPEFQACRSPRGEAPSSWPDDWRPPARPEVAGPFQRPPVRTARASFGVPGPAQGPWFADGIVLVSWPAFSTSAGGRFGR
jgi:hypothetical protein